MPPRLVFTGVCPVSFARRPFATSVGGDAVTCRAQITRPFSVFLTARRGAFCRVISASLWAPLRQLHQRSGAAGAFFGQLGCACHWPLACPFSPHHRTPVHPIVWTGHGCVLLYDLQPPTCKYGPQTAGCFSGLCLFTLLRAEESSRCRSKPQARAPISRRQSRVALRMNQWPAQVHTTQAARKVNSCRYLVCMMTGSCVDKYTMLQ
jgi:hypothetical protein